MLKVRRMFFFGLTAIVLLSCHAAQDKNPFVGTWEPVPDPGVTVFIESLQINDDNTFVAKMTNGHEEMKGTYTIKGGKLMLEAEALKKHHEELQASITDDGRLKLMKSKDDNKGIYFTRK